MSRWRLAIAAVAVWLAAGLGAVAHAQGVCPPVGPPAPLLTGPVNDVNGFPLWWQDNTGLTLQVCLNPDLCFFDPVDPTNPYSVQVGFGPEAFWWLAEGTITAANIDVLVVMAAEAAWAAEVPNPGDQFPFTRLRIRIDTPAAGTYTLTHPYGVEVFEVADAGIRTINESFDIPVPAPFGGRLHTSRIGDFLVWDPAVLPAAPFGYVGDGATPHQVVGSPCGTNFLQIEAVDANNLPIDLDGQGNNILFTDLFVVQGQKFLGTPANVDRTIYGRSTAGQVDVWARSLPGATLTVSGGPNLPAGQSPLVGDGAGNFFGHLRVNNPATLPATVTVTADNSANNPDHIPSDLVSTLVDQVTITRADYDPFGQTLTIEAASSDLLVPPALTAAGFGALTAGVLSVPGVVVPPAFVTVASSAGGSDTEPVTVAVNPVQSVALTSSLPSPQAAGPAITFTGAAAGGTGSYEYRFLLNTAGVWDVVRPFSTDPNWVWTTAGLPSGTYRVRVDAKNAGLGTPTDVSTAINFVLDNNPVTGVSVAALPASPVLSGPDVTFTATPTGGSNVVYRYWLRPPGGAFAVVRAFDANASWVWPTAGLTGGTYQVRVDAKNTTSSAVFDATTSTTYTLSVAPATGVTLFANLPSPQAPGASVLFAAAATGGTGTYQYRFQLRSGGVWSVVQPFGASPTWNWNTAGLPAGSYLILVDARSVGSTNPKETSATLPFVLAVP